MNILFRVDSGTEIGNGHVMRCLTLADALAAQGTNIRFVCRNHGGNLEHMIRDKGYSIALLPLHRSDKNNLNGYEYWLGASQEVDAKETILSMNSQVPDWVVVDHYGIDHVWESLLSKQGCRLFVIDDLANRRHECELLLDQTLGRSVDQYIHLVSGHTTLMLGTDYILLRPEFIKVRQQMTRKMIGSEPIKCLISLGGTDPSNMTLKVLKALESIVVSTRIQFVVVMGNNAPWLKDIAEFTVNTNLNMSLDVDVTDMAKLMSECQIAIGGAGTSTWERCCVGLPGILMMMADNQKDIIQAMSEVKGVIVLNNIKPLDIQLNDIFTLLLNEPELLLDMSETVADYVDGLGTQRIIQQLLSFA